MLIRRLGHITAAAGLVAAATLVATGGSAAAAPVWRVPPPPPTPAGATNSVLQDVSLLGPLDAWAVGAWWNDAVHPFAAHWNGKAWATVPQPELAQQTYLTGVDALTTDDVWAVGSGEVQPGGVILHYDGAAWTVVPSPAGPGSDLDDLDMRTGDDGWAVGHYTKGGATQPIVLHWQGGGWASTAVPDLPGAELTSVSAVAADDVWAVGSVAGTSAVVLHYDGLSWNRVDVPVGFGSGLTSVTATPAGEVWAAGSTCLEVSCAPLVLHGTAAGWRAETTAGGAAVTEIVALSPTVVWTIGFSRSVTGVRNAHVEHWNGQTFQPDNSIFLPGGNGTPNEIASATPLAGAAGDPKTGVIWAVGWSNGPQRAPNVIYRG
jgi:hypothetical protein